MKKRIIKFISVLAAVLMIAASFTVTAAAEEDADARSAEEFFITDGTEESDATEGLPAEDASDADDAADADDEACAEPEDVGTDGAESGSGLPEEDAGICGGSPDEALPDEEPKDLSDKEGSEAEYIVDDADGISEETEFESEYEFLSGDEYEIMYNTPANPEYVTSSSLTKAEFYASSSWRTIDPANSASSMEFIKLQTYNAYFFLEYSVRTSSYEWLSPAYSNNSSMYAGRSGCSIANLSIKVYDCVEGAYDHTHYVVMYRAKVAGEWLDWVSNGSSAAMTSIKSDYSLPGSLDTAGTDSGWISKGNITALQILLFEKKGFVAGSGAKVIDAPYITQKGVGLPNGCESVSAVMAIKYFGISMSTETFVNNYLPMGRAPSNGVGADPNKAYVGDPHLTGGLGWGCYAPVIVKAVKSAIDTQKYQVINATGTSLSSLCANYIDRGIPVILWATVGMTDQVSYSYWTSTEGTSIKYNNMLHCLLLVGYDSNYYYFNDPLKKDGIKKYTIYPRSKVEAAYSLLGKQAVAIRKITCTGITLTSLPSKTKYFVGDAFSSSGLVVKAQYSDGTSNTVTSYTLSGADTSSAGEKTVTVKWNDPLGGTFTAKFTITVSTPLPVTGDADGDRALTMKDVLLCRLVVAGADDENTVVLPAADTDGDGMITMKDILYIRRMIAGV